VHLFRRRYWVAKDISLGEGVHAFMECVKDARAVAWNPSAVWLAKSSGIPKTTIETLVAGRRKRLPDWNEQLEPLLIALRRKVEQDGRGDPDLLLGTTADWKRAYNDAQNHRPVSSPLPAASVQPIDLPAESRASPAPVDGADSRARADFLKRYRRHVSEQHGKLDLLDFGRRRRISIADIYVPAVILQEGGKPHELNPSQFAFEIQRTVLLGEPGSGKTTMVNVLMHHYATAESRIPFLVTLRDFEPRAQQGRSVIAHIEHQLEAFYQCPAPSGLIEQLLQAGRALVLFDGLDEVLDVSGRAEAAAIIEHFSAEYLRCPVIVTSRPAGYDQAQLDDRHFTCYRLEEFGREQVMDYVSKWFAQEEGTDIAYAHRQAEALMNECANVPALSANPLMLSLMCILNRGERSPARNRAEVYQQCATLLFRRWDDRRRIQVRPQVGHLAEPTLCHLAWWMVTSSPARRGVTERMLAAEAASFLASRGFESAEGLREAAAEFINFCRERMWIFKDVGISDSGERLYSFTHRTFLEYFAAAQLADDSGDPEELGRRLAPLLSTDKWQVIGELAIQITSNTGEEGAQRVYAASLGQRRRSEESRGAVLKFLAKSLPSVDLPPEAVRELTCAVLDYFHAGNTDPYTGTRTGPLRWLMWTQNPWREIVNETALQRANAMVESTDRPTQLNGLRLAVWISYHSTGFHLPDVAIPGWRLWRYDPKKHIGYEPEEVIGSHVNAITAPPPRSSEIEYAALLNYLLTGMGHQRDEITPEMLWPLRSQAAGIASRGTAAYLMVQARAVCCGLQGWPILRGIHDPDSIPIRELAAAGCYLLDNPRLPLLTSETFEWPGFFWDDLPEPEVRYPRLKPTGYLGTAAFLAIAAESLGIRALPRQGPERLGPLSALYPYIALRCGISSKTKLPTLPISAKFRQTFRHWADNKVNFTGPMSPAKDSPAERITGRYSVTSHGLGRSR
jgi:NACHT domain